MGISEYMFVHVIYPRNTQAYNHSWTSTWMNQKGYITFAYYPSMNMAKNTLNHVIYPRNTQAYSDARTSTWMNQKGYITFAY